MTNAVRNALNRVADLCWPRVCPVADCGRASDRPARHICSTCFAALPLLEAGGECALCGMPVPAETHHEFVCEACQKEPPAFVRARSALRYLGPVPQLIQDFKYRRAIHLAEDFADLLEAAVRAKFRAAELDAVLPVPLHPHPATASMSLPPHQARSSGSDRRKNLHAAFHVPDPAFVRGRTLLLVDDVMTTGSTLSACAKELRNAGAHRVWCLTLARALR